MFLREWGYDPTYVAQALRVIEAADSENGVKAGSATLGRFLADSPDCNPGAIQHWLIEMLRDLAAADGRLDEREELAIEAIDRTLREAFVPSLTRVWEGVAGRLRKPRPANA